MSDDELYADLPSEKYWNLVAEKKRYVQTCLSIIRKI